MDWKLNRNIRDCKLKNRNIAFPSLTTTGSPSERSITVDATLSPYPPSITISTKFPHFSKISSGSVVYSNKSSSSCMDVDTIGFPSSLTNNCAMVLSGTRIPTVFFFLNSLGRLLFPGNMKV